MGLQNRTILKRFELMIFTRLLNWLVSIPSKWAPPPADTIPKVRMIELLSESSGQRDANSIRIAIRREIKRLGMD